MGSIIHSKLLVMKKILLALAILVCSGANAQTINTVKSNTTTTTRKPIKKTKTAMSKHETYTSKSGKMTARSLGKYEQPDTPAKVVEGGANHVNSNYNESMPPLSPNSGSSAPYSK